MAAGHVVRCLARTPSKLDGLPWRADVEVVEADVLDRPTLDEALAGVDVVVHLVHAMGDTEDFADAEQRGAANVRDAAASSDVRQIVYLGGLGDDEGSTSRHLRSRHAVGEVLADGPVPLTELRAAVIIGSGSASFEMLRSLVEVLPVMVTPRWVNRTRCQPVAIRDVLTYLVGVIDRPEALGQVLDIGGPDVVTYREMMDVYARVAGLPRRRIAPVPLLSPRLSSHWINVVTPLPIGLARPLVDSLTTDVVVRPAHDVRRVVPHDPIPLDDAIGRALHRLRDLDVLTSWTGASAPDRAAEPFPSDPGWSGGTLLRDVQQLTTIAPASAVYAVASGIGGDRGWYAYDSLWRLRGVADKLIGGVGMRRGRRHPDELRVGDALDFWRVEIAERPREVRLRAEMLLPGEAWLDWQVEEDAEGSTLRQLALFAPKGLWGRIYWYSLVPFHGLIFGALNREIVRRAEALARATTRPIDPEVDEAGRSGSAQMARTLRASSPLRPGPTSNSTC
jgi:uncharacterized protein YbjT (DUF2867 family)